MFKHVGTTTICGAGLFYFVERFGRHDEYLYPDRASAKAALEKEQLDDLERKRKELAELEARAFRSKGKA